MPTQSRLNATNVLGKSYDTHAYKEAEAGAELTPGMLVEVTGYNDDHEPVLEPASGETDAVRIVLVQEHPPQGGATGDRTMPVDQTIPVGSNVEYATFSPGDEVNNALLATAAAPAAGDKIVSAGGGEHGVYASADDAAGDILGVAYETNGDDSRLYYEVI